MLLCALMLVPAAGAAAASLWTPLNSGTSDQITGIATPQAGEIVYVTSAGHIEYFNGSTFQPATVPTTVFGLSAVAFSADGVHGVAVGQDGDIYASADSGHDWTADSKPMEFESGSCSGWTDPEPLSDDLNSVRFVPSSNHVFVTGANNDVLESVDNGAHFSEVNKSGSGCVANSQNTFTDTAWLNSTTGFLVSEQFGGFFRTTDGFTGSSGGTVELTGDDVVLDTYSNPVKLAVDASHQSDIWEAGGNGSSAGIGYSTDGGDAWSIANYSTPELNILEDIANVGTTVVAVGQSGDIWTSPDGKNFYQQDAGAPYSSTNWDAVSMVPGTDEAVVGGDGGSLVITTKANQLPDKTPPTGHISGPPKLAPGQFGTYTVSASDNPGGSGINGGSFRWAIPEQPAQTGTTARFAFSKPGTYDVTVSFTDLAGNPASASITVKVSAPGPTGSGQKTTTTGGGKVGIYKKVTVPKGSGRDRYIPIYLLDKTPRKFVITLLTVQRKHKKQKTLAKLTTTLKKGHKDVHLKLPNGVKSGSYELEVRLYTTGKHAKAVGKRVKQLFVLD
jgi:photosystem II stability/assembly factor-like uncharacterized protein